MIKKAILTLLCLAVVGFGGFAVFAYRPAISPIRVSDLPAFDPEVVEQGRLMAAAGFCSECHSAPGNPPYAGGYGMETGFGTLYSTNITPDPETGIGSWSEEAFVRAMHEGVDREGRHLFPAFPYDHFTLMTEADVRAIYAYLMTEVEPVVASEPESGLPFPLNLRIWQAGWKLLFVDLGRFEPDPDKSAEWNRGAYLVEGATHCGACHTPRNLLGAEIRSKDFEGAAIDRWIAPALTAENPAIIRWTAEEFTEYLKSGATRAHGVAAGPMAPVVHAGLQELPDSDLKAIGIYLGDVVGAPQPEAEVEAAIEASLRAGQPSAGYREELGERLYASACAACHYNATQIVPGRPDLGINSATRLDAPDNLLQVILNGVGNEEGMAGVVMPGFRNALSDDEVAAIAAYLRASRTDAAHWPELANTVARIRNAHAE
ncbi:cytochrome c [Celeribacter halophilus]|jgi:mono/diheme cytochrome c family protein|uniref:c-type cytochrome n=1 Tax=Celeribacter halophilus TaxID=576117 RepID=UPI0026E3D21B|nr:cytochrome c [Celeribacter halophilus]MDO6725144.1 cytochrome c [Celeribacter halophilus]